MVRLPLTDAYVHATIVHVHTFQQCDLQNDGKHLEEEDKFLC